MSIEYILIRSDEDGNPIRWLDHVGLRELLRDPRERYGVEQFLHEVPDRRDPASWHHTQGLLLKVEVVVPQPSGAYELPLEHR